MVFFLQTVLAAFHHLVWRIGCKGKRQDFRGLPACLSLARVSTIASIQKRISAKD